MIEVLNNPEVQAALFIIIGALGVWLRMRTNRLEAKSKAIDISIETQATNQANLAKMQANILDDLKQSKAATERAQAERDAMAERTKTIEQSLQEQAKAQAYDKGQIDQLQKLFDLATQRYAEKTLQFDEQAKTLSDLQAKYSELLSKQGEMADALGLKDETIRKYEKEIADLRDLQVIDRDEISKLKAQIEAQQLRLDELEQVNKLVAQGKRATNDTTNITLAVISNESVPISNTIDKDMLK